MLEGQVAVLSAGVLEPHEVVDLLDSMRDSKLYRSDQNSYILYPNKALPNFLQKNHIPHHMLIFSPLLTKMLEVSDASIIEMDLFSQFHFNGNFRNSSDLSDALKTLDKSRYGEIDDQERELILEIYEHLFNHKEFTGRSGTFYGYEGLGSIYWHMVSKLILAVQENYQAAVGDNASIEIVDKLANHYYEIWNGLGVHKDPKLYGAFTTDPYSHTPYHKGAQQPGMTGQVKEDIISRFGELGVLINDGLISFQPTLLKKEEFLKESSSLRAYNIHAEPIDISLPADSLCFTLCQVPIIYTLGKSAQITITLKDGITAEIINDTLSTEYSTHVLQRSGKIEQINVIVEQDSLK